MTLGEKLKYLRRMENLSQNRLADILHIERSTYAYYESDRTRPDIYKLYAIAQIYGLPMAFFVNENWEMKEAEPSAPSRQKSLLSCKFGMHYKMR